MGAPALRVRVTIGAVLVGFTLVAAAAGHGGLALFAGTIAATATLSVLRELVNRENRP